MVILMERRKKKKNVFYARHVNRIQYILSMQTTIKTISSYWYNLNSQSISLYSQGVPLYWVCRVPPAELYLLHCTIFSNISLNQYIIFQRVAWIIDCMFKWITKSKNFFSFFFFGAVFSSSSSSKPQKKSKEQTCKQPHE